MKPTKSIYHPGDEIKCLADSKPSPKYEWINLDDDNLTVGAVFVITGNMVRQERYNLQCKATNEVETRNITMGAALNISFMVHYAGKCDRRMCFYLIHGPELGLKMCQNANRGVTPNSARSPDLKNRPTISHLAVYGLKMGSFWAPFACPRSGGPCGPMVTP